MSSTRAPVKDTLGSLQYLIWHELLHTWKETSTRAPPPPADWAWAHCINNPNTSNCLKYHPTVHVSIWTTNPSALMPTKNIFCTGYLCSRLEQIETSAVQILRVWKNAFFSSWPICFPWHSWRRPFFRRSWSGSGAYKKRIGLRKPWKGVFRGRR